MNPLPDIAQRRPVWIALSDFYLDTELQAADFNYTAKVILKSPYSLEDVKKIDKYELFPLLYSNLLSVAGVWAGFEETWLEEQVIARLKKKTKLDDLMVDTTYAIFKWMYDDYWKKLEKACEVLRAQSPDDTVI